MDERYTKGLEVMGAVVGDYAARLGARFDPIAPGFVQAMIGYAFGEIYTRPGLDLRTRELVTVAVLTAMGTAGQQLAVHIQGALKVGCSRAEIAEAIIQASLYAGIPAALNALSAAQPIFDADPADMPPAMNPSP